MRSVIPASIARPQFGSGRFLAYPSDWGQLSTFSQIRNEAFPLPPAPRPSSESGGGPSEAPLASVRQALGEFSTAFFWAFFIRLGRWGLFFLGNFPFFTDFAGDGVPSGTAPPSETTFPAAVPIAFAVLTKTRSLVFGLSAIAQLYPV